VTRLTEDQLSSMEQWAACDLRDEDGREVQEMVDEIRELRAALDRATNLHTLAERAMRSANQASRDFEALAMEHFDAKEPLEVVANAARAFVAVQDQLACGDFAGDKFEDLKRALDAAPQDPRVAALIATQGES
jgi:hypothetical protein